MGFFKKLLDLVDDPNDPKRCPACRVYGEYDRDEGTTIGHPALSPGSDYVTRYTFTCRKCGGQWQVLETIEH